MKKLLALSAAIASTALSSACSINWGQGGGDTVETQTQLKEANYKIVKTNATASSNGVSILFIPMSTANPTDAVNEICGRELTPGKPQALANVFKGTEIKDYILWQTTKLTVRADVVEFTPPQKAEK